MLAASSLANRPSGRMSGGRAMAEMLSLAGAGPMFGMGGFQLLAFYDAARRLRRSASTMSRSATRRTHASGRS